MDSQASITPSFSTANVAFWIGTLGPFFLVASAIPIIMWKRNRDFRRQNTRYLPTHITPFTLSINHDLRLQRSGSSESPGRLQLSFTSEPSLHNSASIVALLEALEDPIAIADKSEHSLSNRSCVSVDHHDAIVPDDISVPSSTKSLRRISLEVDLINEDACSDTENTLNMKRVLQDESPRRSAEKHYKATTPLSSFRSILQHDEASVIKIEAEGTLEMPSRSSHPPARLAVLSYQSQASIASSSSSPEISALLTNNGTRPYSIYPSHSKILLLGDRRDDSHSTTSSSDSCCDKHSDSDYSQAQQVQLENPGSCLQSSIYHESDEIGPIHETSDGLSASETQSTSSSIIVHEDMRPLEREQQSSPVAPLCIATPILTPAPLLIPASTVGDLWDDDDERLFSTRVPLSVAPLSGSREKLGNLCDQFINEDDIVRPLSASGESSTRIAEVLEPPGEDDAGELWDAEDERLFSALRVSLRASPEPAHLVLLPPLRSQGSSFGDGLLELDMATWMTQSCNVADKDEDGGTIIRSASASERDRDPDAKMTTANDVDFFYEEGLGHSPTLRGTTRFAHWSSPVSPSLERPIDCGQYISPRLSSRRSASGSSPMSVSSVLQSSRGPCFTFQYIDTVSDDLAEADMDIEPDRSYTSSIIVLASQSCASNGALVVGDSDLSDPIDDDMEIEPDQSFTSSILAVASPSYASSRINPSDSRIPVHSSRLAAMKDDYSRRSRRRASKRARFDGMTDVSGHLILGEHQNFGSFGDRQSLSWQAPLSACEMAAQSEISHNGSDQTRYPNSSSMSKIDDQKDSASTGSDVAERQHGAARTSRGPSRLWSSSSAPVSLDNRPPWR